ncbi:uncharacterized protein LOC143229861 isoform X2 [Tachypleus tridentatus]|uniref:uncharacterized protein LOC143229861 isoform X2 n=1 Tax=Tachypleus tridentatus TaxID=6853 RepID=UPI003FCF8B37
MTFLNLFTTVVLLAEQGLLFALIFPWIKPHKWAQWVGFFRRFKYSNNLTFTVYFSFALVFLILNFVALELHELQVQEAMKQSFDEFRGNVFTCLRICVIIHRILHLTLANYDLQNLTVSLENRIQFILREKLLGKTDQWTVSEENLLEPIFSKEQELKEMKKKLLEAQKAKPHLAICGVHRVESNHLF